MKNFILVLLYRSFAFLPLSLSRACGRGLGWLVLTLELSHVQITRVNLRLCYPELSADAIEQLCKQHMLHLGQVFLETPRLWDSSAEWLESKILSVEGLDLLEEALAGESGTILVCPHQGNWEVVGPWITQYTKLTILYDPPKIASLGRWIKTSRERSGATLVPASIRGVAALTKALKRGETTGILPEQLYSEDQVTAISALNDDAARIVALAPAQYQWEYKRFRMQPDGRDIYAKDT